MVGDEANNGINAAGEARCVWLYAMQCKGISHLQHPSLSKCYLLTRQYLLLSTAILQHVNSSFGETLVASNPDKILACTPNLGIDINVQATKSKTPRMPGATYQHSIVPFPASSASSGQPLQHSSAAHLGRPHIPPTEKSSRRRTMKRFSCR